MAQTTSAQMIIPEVYGDMAQAKFVGQMKVGNSSAVLSDNSLQGVPGETIHFPKWGTLGELDTLTETVAMVPVAMSTDDSEATILEAGKAVEVTDRSNLVGLGDPLTEARRQFGVLAARRVDAALITQAQADETAQGGSTPLSVAQPAGSITFTWLDTLVPAIAAFGDEFEPGDFAGLFLHSSRLAEAFADTQFIDAAKFGAATPVQTGSLGRLGGIDVFVTDRVAQDKVLLLKNQSLGLLYKQRPVVEQDRDILARSTVVTTTLHYAVKRLDDKGVAVVTIPAV